MRERVRERVRVKTRERGGERERERKREHKLDQRVLVNRFRVRFSQLRPWSQVAFDALYDGRSGSAPQLLTLVQYNR